MEEIFTLQNEKAHKLIGIAHIPEDTNSLGKKIGINLLNPGVKYRVAPNRLNVKLARHLCEKGYYVFRFDPFGIGDSEGDLSEDVPLQDIFESIQTGSFVDDTVTANKFLAQKYQIDEFIMIGNCGGAISALFTANIDSLVQRICLIDVPINLRTAKMTFADKISQDGGKADWYMEEYIKKIFSIKAWYRFLSFKTEYKALWKIIGIKFKKYFNKGNHGLPSNIKTLCEESNLNIHFFENIDIYLNNNKNALFILAENDPGTEIFGQYFENGYLKIKYPNGLENLKIKTIKNANHVYSLIESQKELINEIDEWLKHSL